MTLKKKFLPFVDDIDLINEKPNKEKRLRNANKCVEVEDEFAIGFFDWFNSKEAEDLMHDLVIVGEVDINTTTKELLEIYKKEKGL